MQAKSEGLLYLLPWACDMLARPGFRNLTGSFEGWAYCSGLQRQLAELERQTLSASLHPGGDRLLAQTVTCCFDPVARCRPDRQDACRHTAGGWRA